MLERFEQRYLADGGRWHSVVFLFESDFFERDCLSRELVDGFVYHAIGSLSQFVQFLVPVDLRRWLDELLLLLLWLLLIRCLA